MEKDELKKLIERMTDEQFAEFLRRVTEEFRRG
jgi:hypothetical protein